MSEDWMIALLRMEENTKKIAEALEGLNKLIVDFMITLKADKIVQEITAEEKTFVTQEAKMTWEMEYEGKNYKFFKPCKYKCGFWSGFGKPYIKGERPLHINPATKEILGFECPKYAEGG